jgi:hypothetical protein
MTSDKVFKLIEDNKLTLHGDIEHFAELVRQDELQACIELLLGLHQAQSNNGNHNYYRYAANTLKDLRGSK